MWKFDNVSITELVCRAKHQQKLHNFKFSLSSGLIFYKITEEMKKTEEMWNEKRKQKTHK